MSSRLTALAIAATASLAGVATASAATTGNTPYVAGDMHNHNTCTDGSVSVGYAIDRTAGTGTAAAGGTNFNLDWFTLGNHGGSGNRDCRFSDASAAIPGDNTTTFWDQTLGQTVDGITINSLLGTPNTSSGHPTMWRWQNIQQVEWPYILNRSQQYGKVLVEGLEWITPGHEHTDVAVIAGQNPLARKASLRGNADAMAQFEFLFDAADNDQIGPVDSNNNPIWTGKIANTTGTTGHAKAVAGVTWLQTNYPTTSYAVPTHSERKGPFSTTANAGWNIEHFRDFNNAGPTVAFGIEAPGHFAEGGPSGGSGSYGSGAVGGGTYGLSGVYTAKIGGLWDGLLAEGRNSFIYVSSDWHQRGIFGATQTGTTADFIPGEYTKLYVRNTKPFTAQVMLNGMRSGNSYSVNGDLIGPNMVFTAQVCNPTCGNPAVMGQVLVAPVGATILVSMSVTVPTQNYSPYSFNNPLLTPVGISQPLNKPKLDHVDLITSTITGVVQPTDAGYAVANASGTNGAAIVYNPNAVLAKQISASKMKKKTNLDGSTTLAFQTTFTMPANPFYIRARGTNIPVNTPNVTDATGAPLLDVNNTNVSCNDAACPSHLDVVNGSKRVVHDVQAWSNLWFYGNPIFFRPANSSPLLVETNGLLAGYNATVDGTGTKTASAN